MELAFQKIIGMKLDNYLENALDGSTTFRHANMILALLGHQKNKFV